MSTVRTRDQIIHAADRLFYQRGYEQTSFSDIAAAVKISRGNFYFHFRTKDQILAAVLELRLANTQRMLEAWEEERSPAARLHRFITMMMLNRDDIRRFGCPVGTLCSELSKVGHPAHAQAARLFNLFRVWLRRQFEAAGCASDADDLAMHLLARSQGIAVLASAFQDKAYVRQEAKRLADWLSQVLRSGVPRKRAKRVMAPQRSLAKSIYR